MMIDELKSNEHHLLESFLLREEEEMRREWSLEVPDERDRDLREWVKRVEWGSCEGVRVQERWQGIKKKNREIKGKIKGN